MTASETVRAHELSIGQERTWYLHEVYQGNPVFTLSELVLVSGELRVEALRTALGVLAERHDVLRMVFPVQDGRTRAVVHAELDLPLAVGDGDPERSRRISRRARLDVAEDESEAARLSRIRSWASEVSRQPFDVVNGPLWRVRTMSFGPDEHAMILCAHHLVADRRSLAVLLDELTRIYTATVAGEPHHLPAATSFGPLADAERLAEGALRPALAARVAELTGQPAGIELPADKLRPPALGFAGSVVVKRFSAGVRDDLDAFARDQGTNAESVLLAAFAVLVHRYTGVTDLVLGTPPSRRDTAVGPLTTLRVLRADFTGDPTFLEALDRVRRAVDDAEAHSDVPFELLVPELETKRDLSRRPVCQIGFEVRHAVAGPTMTTLTFDQGSAAFDLALVLRRSADGVELVFEYDTDLFEQDSITRLAENFTTLVTHILAKPDEHIGRQRLLADDQAARGVVEWNDTSVDFPQDKLIHQLIAEQAERKPDAVALVAGDERLTFGELDRRANQVANHLRGLGVGPQVPVAVCLPRSLGMVIGVLGVLKAGGAAVLLDPAQPTRRLGAMLDDSRAPVLLTSETLLPIVPSTYAGQIRCLDRDRELIARAGYGAPPQQAHWLGLCQVAYTSGSTGEPRGVAFHHGAVLLGALGTQHAYSLTETDRGTWISAPGFGISFVNELWPFLSVGAEVHIADETVIGSPFRLRDWLIDSGITVSVLSKALADRVCAADWPSEVPLRILMVSGERVGWLPTSVPFETVTIYGSTETTNITTCLNEATGKRHTPKSVPSQRRRGATSPVGRPVPNAAVHLLDDHLQPVPAGVTGQVFVGGDLIQSGYLNRPDLTALKWLPDPFSRDPGGRMVATGDLGRALPDGVIELLGRADEQISLNGYRIELGEVVSRLQEHPSVRTATVLVREDEPGERRMVGYVVPEPNRRPSTGDLREMLREHLPAYMVPGTFVMIDALPTLPNGKVDRRALPAPGTSSDSRGPHVAPSTPTQETLAELWAQVLRQARVGVRDNYFELGGDSLTGMELMASVSSRFAVELPLRVLFDAPTVEEMATVVERAREGGVDAAGGRAELPMVVAGPDDRYEPFPLTDIQHAYWIGRTGGIELGDVGCHGYQEWDVEGLDTDRLRGAIDRLVRRHDMLRAIVMGDGRQCVLPDVPPYQLDVADLRELDADRRSAAVTRIREDLSHQVLPSDRWPLFDVRVTVLDDIVSRVHVSFDLLIFDARSARIFTQELSRLYTEPSLELPALELSFRDYVMAERAAQQDSPLYQRAREYWQERLDDLPPAPELPYLRSLGSVGTPRFVRRAGRLDPDTWGGLRQAAASAGITPSALLLAAFAEVLAQWSAGPRFTINLTLFNRPPLHPQLNDLLGDFTSGLLHAVESTGETFADRARAVQDRLWHDLEHRYTSSVQVMRALTRKQGGGAPRAAMPVVFSSLVGVPRMEWGSLGTYVYGVTQTPQVALDHQVMEVDGGLDYCWDAVAELFPDGLVGDMAEAYGDLLRGLATDQGVWQREQPIRPPAAQIARRAEVNATDAPIAEGLLHEPFVRQAALTPDVPAVIAEGRTWSYRRLDEVSAAIAHRLVGLGAEPNRLVAIVMRKGAEQVAAALGVVRAGAAYLPIDPALPAERIDYLLANGQIDVVLTQPEVDLAVRRSVTTILVPSDGLPGPTEPLPPNPARPDDLAYVIYTSGSTGDPKGVMIEHRAALNTVLDINRRFRVDPADKVLAISSLSFDLSVWDVFGVLGAGGTVVLPTPSDNPDPRAWCDLLAEHGVTLWNSVPALLQILTDYVRGRGDRLTTTLRAILLSGDWIPLTTYDHLREVAPGVRLVSLGGATEASIWSIAHEMGPSDPDWVSVPYGRPLTNQRWHVLDAGLRPRPDWVTGGLFIAGEGLARGYWRDEEKSAARFVVDPHTGERLYRTGDLGRYRPSGDLEILGREDFQVKILGHRVELGEIEAALQAHPAVASCCVIALGEPRTARRLIAHVVVERETAPTADELREFLEGKLVGDVVPALYHLIPALPLTGNGKVDRQALAALGEPAKPDGVAEAPATPTEELLLKVAGEVLGADWLNPTDDFFRSGGDSLRAIAMINAAAEAGLDIPVELFFQNPTMRALGARLDEAEVPVDVRENGPMIVDLRAGSTR